MEENKEDVIFLYVHKFKWHTDGESEAMGGHPKQGRVYRGIVDRETGTTKLFIGKDNTPIQIEGIVLKKLKGNSIGWSCDLEEITPENFFNLDITSDDAKRMTEWEEMNHKDIERFIGVDVNTAPKAKNLPEEHADEYDDELIDLEHEIKLVESLNTTLNGDTDFHMAMVDLIHYLASTFDEKYEEDELSNLSKKFLYHSKLGKGANIFTATKYLQRYATEGYSKSENVEDLQKAIHYILFELTRRRLHG